MGKLLTLLIGLIIITVFATGLRAFMGGLETEYLFQANTSAYDSYYNITNVTYIQAQFGNSSNENSIVGSMYNNTQTWDTADTTVFSWFSWADWIVKSFASTFKLVLNVGNTTSAMATESGNVLGIPGYVMSAVGVILMIVIVLLVVGILLGKDY
jgi:hypothetical protein